jgi:hypothetical protein
MTLSHLFQNSALLFGLSFMGAALLIRFLKPKQKGVLTLILAFTGFFLLSGCTGQAIPGGTVKHKRSLDFYMSNGRGGYAIIEEGNYPSILAGAAWILDDGLTLVEDDLTLSPTEVTWTSVDGRTKYTAQGVKLTVEVEVKVAEDAVPGWRGIRLILPGLQRFGQSRGVTAVFPEINQLPGVSEEISIAGVTVHETAAARNLAILKNIGVMVLIGVVVLGVILLVFAIGNWSRR